MLAVNGSACRQRFGRPIPYELSRRTCQADHVERRDEAVGCHLIAHKRLADGGEGLAQGRLLRGHMRRVSHAKQA